MRRGFSTGVRKEAMIRADFRCELCGDNDSLCCSYIYSKSYSPYKIRSGSNPFKVTNREHVSSETNCVVLCQRCDTDVNSKQGRIDYSVKYLESLIVDKRRCNVIVDGERCKKKRVDDDASVCKNHLEL